VIEIWFDAGIHIPGGTYPGWKESGVLFSLTVNAVGKVRTWQIWEMDYR